jgi:ribosomal protein S18 acetylase RimI-like enzyme
MAEALSVKIVIVKGTMKHLKGCTEALIDSEIGAAYFPTAQEAEAFLQQGLTKGEVFVAIDEQGDCVGYIWFTLAGAFYRFPYLLNIAVKKDLRGKGIGKKLLAIFEEQGFAKASRLFLLVSDFNAKAKKLYQAIGYKEVGVIPDLIKEGVAEHIMMKSKKGLR